MYYLDNRLAALAVIPGLLIIIYVYGKDKVEKEPIGVILKVLIFGAISCELAGIVEGLLFTVYPQYEAGTVGYALVNGFCLAAFCEEILKYLALRLGSWKHRSFNYRFDGIVYGVSSAVGFAVWENLAYVAHYGFQTAVVRAFTAVPLHAFCGVFMGVFYAYAKKASILGDRKSCSICTFLALIVPMLIHGVYDFLAMVKISGATYVLLVFVIFLYIVAIKTVNKMSREDRNGGFYPEARNIDFDANMY